MTCKLAIKGSYRADFSDFYLVDSPTHFDGHLNLGCAFAVDNKLKVAIEEYQDALTQNQFSLEANQFIGQAYLELHDKASAIKYFKRSLRIKDKAEINYLLGILLLPSAMATDCFRRALQKDADPDCHMLFAKSLYHHQNFENDDESLLEATLEDFPDSEYVLTSLARVQRNKQKYDLAEINYRSAIFVDMRNPDNYTELADMLTQLERFDEAKEMYEHAHIIRPSLQLEFKIAIVKRKDKERIKKRLKRI